MSSPKTTQTCFLRSPYMSIKYSTYFDVYDRLFDEYVGKDIVFVEVGVLNGGSLFMWREYFGDRARIIGVDLNPEAARWRESGFEIYIGNQADPEFWRGILPTIGIIDILLDDGGHTFEQQIVTVAHCLPAIKDGGLLVVEDAHTSYMPEYGGPSKMSFISYAKNIVDGINYRSVNLSTKKPQEENVYSVEFCESIVAFRVDRARAGRRCQLLKNDGKSAEAVDYRYYDSHAISSLNSIGSKLRWLEGVPILGSFAMYLFKTVRLAIAKTVNFRRLRTLTDLFRY